MDFPLKFKEYLEEAAGEKAASVLDALSGEVRTSIRLNPSKLSLDAGRLHFPGSQCVPWCSNGLLLPQRPVFTLDPLFHAGAYYVQEPSSMIVDVLKEFLEDIASQTTGNINILDAAASPGGKSTHLSAIKPENSILISNEAIRGRVSALVENIEKWGDNSVIVTNNDPSKFSKLPPFFHLILADLPCSGEGMFRKNRDQVLTNWSEENVKLSAMRQRRIISDLWPSLLPGGYIAYSTCTFNIYENDLNIKWIKEQFGAMSVDLSFAGVRVSPEGGLQFFPGEIEGEGLYFALLKKPEELYTNKHISLQDYTKRLNVINLTHNINSPAHYFALLQNYDQPFPSHELVSKEAALRYLSKGNINKNDFSQKDLPLGFIRVTYNGLGLGFIKNIGNRINNLFPIEKRIRMQLPLGIL